ncbi:MAG: nucleoside hydrolase [Candidatus Electrothrix sp. AUS1_2]|nr:nucleoside hydrolase [Candidatus Electrothrix sp. AUS1_2]
MRAIQSDRKQRFFSVFLGCLLLCAVFACREQNEAPQGELLKEIPRLILDTDLSSDVDDVGAVALLHGLANQGKVRILAMQISSGDPWSVPCLAALNTWFGRPDIPIGMVKGKAVQHESKYTRAIAEEFPHKGKSGSEAPDAVMLYRRILAEQPDHTVTLVTIGYLTNLANLLRSEGDEISPLNGMDLVRQKIQRLVCMGGQYPSGREWNFYQDTAASAYVVEHWPTPIVFSGFEIGKDVLTGAALQGMPQPNPVRRSYELYNGLTDRPSWDQVAVYYAVTTAATADEGETGLWSKNSGRNVVRPDGSNYWLNKRDQAADHAYLVQHAETAHIAELLEQLMLTARQ